MSGFPTRISRSALGQAKTNARPVKDASKELVAGEWNLMRWTLGGLAGTGAQAWLFATFTGPTTIAVTAHREAWDPDADDAAPTISRTSDGLYVVTYAATYTDEAGTAVATQLYGGDVSPSATTNLNGVASIASSRIVTVSIFTANSAVATDSSFLLVVY